MSQRKFNSLNLSVDEIAMIFSLINQPELGKSVIMQAYGEIDPSVIDEKLTTASHSLLARELASITENDTVQLDENVETLLSPLVSFFDILQVTINSNQPDGPEIINIYLGNNHLFTALRIQMGVVYKLTHGKIKDLPELVVNWLDLPESCLIKTDLLNENFQINMPALASISDLSLQQGYKLLEENGLPHSIAKSLAKDSKTPAKRGSVVLSNITSENYEDKNIEEAGAGFLYLVGEETSWVFSFNEASDTTTAIVLPGTSKLAFEQLTSMLA